MDVVAGQSGRCWPTRQHAQQLRRRAVGDIDELTTFCADQLPRLVGLLALHTGDRLVAEDLAHDALVAVCEKWPRIRSMERREAYVSRIAVNLAASRWRRQSAARRAAARRGPDPTVHSDPDGADATAVRQAVATLPQRQRTALVLRYYAGLSVAEIADELGCATGTVTSLTSRAVAALRHELGIELDESTALHPEEAHRG
jgi:RNA polymerase sigma-70 factor (sigma-E family)